MISGSSMNIFVMVVPYAVKADKYKPIYGSKVVLSLSKGLIRTYSFCHWFLQDLTCLEGCLLRQLHFQTNHKC